MKNNKKGGATVYLCRDVQSALNTAAQVKIDVEVCRYIVNLIRATRTSRSLSLGASPRASIMLMKLAAWSA